MSPPKVGHKRKHVTALKITPDEDTRPECRNVGSWIVTSLGYVHKILTNQSSIILWMIDIFPSFQNVKKQCEFKHLKQTTETNVLSWRCSEYTVKMLRVALFTERGRCWEYSWDYKLSILLICLARIIILSRRRSYTGRETVTRRDFPVFKSE